MAKTHAVTAQVLLLCCWRTHKEVSLLFGDIAERIPVCDDGNVDEMSLLSVSQVMDIGQYFIRQMSLVKHKGAFEQAFIGFSKLCHMLWRSDINMLPELPKVWLNDLLLAIRGLKANMHLCSTRRSAGLPFIVQALLTSDPCLASSSFFKSTISSLLSIGSVTNEDKSQEEKIHALNILRALFRDACLGDVLVPFVSEGLNVSITGFKSKSWAVRNSSTLLFSALMTRIFGVTRPQDETGRKNRLTGRTFFSYYKDTYSFLYEELKNCVSVLMEDQNSVSLVPALYPVLLVLGRLYPAPGESDQRLASFVPFLRTCGNSSVWKVRALAAKVIVPLVPAEMVKEVLRSLFLSLNAHDRDSLCQNRDHGKCLQILSFLKEVPHLSQDKKTTIESFLPIWVHSAAHLASSSNMCYTTRAAYLEIILSSMTMNTTLDSDLTVQLISDALSEINGSSSLRLDKEQYLCTTIVVSMLSLMRMEKNQMQEQLPTINKKYNCLTDLFEDFLDTPYESIHCSVLYFLVCLFGGNKVLDNTDLECSMFPVFFPSLFGERFCASIQACEVVCVDLRQNKELTVLVIAMLAKKKNNSSCLGIVCQLLSLMPLAVESPWEFIKENKGLCHYQKLEYVLIQLNNCNRDDVYNQIMLFATQVFLNICGCFQNKKLSLPSFSAPEHREYYTILNLWLQKLTECTQPESCISRRKMTISAFQSIFHPSMVEKLKVLGDISAKLWQCLVFLLTDDEPDIKQQATEIVMLLWASKMSGEKSLPVVPLLALDHVAQLFIQEQTCSSPTYIGVFLNWMLTGQHLNPETAGDERPFDPGELNVFAEDYVLANHMMIQLSRHVISNNCESTTLVDIDRIECWHHIDRNKDEPFDINDVMQLCLTESETLVEGLLSHCAGSSVFDARFDRDMIQLVQRCLVVMALSSCPSVQFKSRGLELWRKMKGIGCRTYFMDCVLDDFRQSCC